ncbi:uncharacterized protein V6R79_006909 [Siganus canaliculatus]
MEQGDSDAEIADTGAGDDGGASVAAVGVRPEPADTDKAAVGVRPEPATKGKGIGNPSLVPSALEPPATPQAPQAGPGAKPREEGAVESMEEEEGDSLPSAQVMRKERKRVERASVAELDQLSSIKAQLVQLQKQKSEAAALRARVDTYLYEEKYSAYFLGLEKQRQERQMIKELIEDQPYLLP